MSGFLSFVVRTPSRVGPADRDGIRAAHGFAGAGGTRPYGVNPPTLVAVVAGGGWQDLTERESAVLAAVERRLTNAEIAAEFVISVRTVESHIAALRRKLGVDNRADLVAVARSRR